MKVVIAHPLAAEAHGVALDDTVDLDDTEARTLLNDGWARLPDKGKKSRSSNPTTSAPTGDDNEGA